MKRIEDFHVLVQNVVSTAKDIDSASMKMQLIHSTATKKEWEDAKKEWENAVYAENSASFYLFWEIEKLINVIDHAKNFLSACNALDKKEV